MRLIATFDTEEKAYILNSFLHREGIKSNYEYFKDPLTEEETYQLWIYEEEDLERAFERVVDFQEHPTDSKFQLLKENPKEEIEEDKVGNEKQTPLSKEQTLPWRIKVNVSFNRNKMKFALTHLILGLCILLFLWNGIQEAKIVKAKGQIIADNILTPLQENLIFDYPLSFQKFEETLATYPIDSLDDIKNLPLDAQAAYESAERIPAWKGFYDILLNRKKQGDDHLKRVPMFEKIKQGQFWRLFTPCLLHKDFLHILFNMSWLWVLGLQIEKRIGKWRLFFLVLILSVISNVAQYLISGPYFLGFSAVAVGMAGFIWMRQRKAPWEGYPLQKSTFLFLLFFVAAMFVLEVIALGLQLFNVTTNVPSIANTAHIVGGLIGMYLATFSFFSRKIL